MERPIRVLVGKRPRLTRELILTTFSDPPDIEIVGEVADEADIPASVEKTNPDVIVIAQDKLGSGPASATQCFVNAQTCESLLLPHIITTRFTIGHLLRFTRTASRPRKNPSWVFFEPRSARFAA